MKKVTTLSSVALTALTLVAVASPLIASADTTWTSNDTVTFNAPTDSTTPPDVTNPTDPTTPPSVIPSQPGAQAVDFASAIDFGTHQLDGATTDFVGSVTAGTTGDAGKPLLAWHDLDGASPAVAYKITAQVTTPFNMAGSVITYGAGTAVNTSGSGATDITSIATNGDTVLDADGGGTAQTVVTGTGAVDGHYADKFGAVSLYVPVASQTAGQHTAVVTWTMTNAL